MDSSALQQELFKIIKSKLSAHQSLNEVVQELFKIGADSAYRRIRGEKQLLFEELQKLCEVYKISLDQLMNFKSDTTIFHGNYLDKTNFDFSKYLGNILSNLDEIASLPGAKIFIDTKDIPPFHYYQFTELAAFKYFVWMQFLLQYDEYNKISFEEHDLMQPLLDTGKKITAAYCRIPSIEIWNLETINSTIRQIGFYYESGIIAKKATAELLYEQLITLIAHIESQAETGKKFLHGTTPAEQDAEFRMFANGVFLGDNTILVTCNNESRSYVTHGVLNFMTTQDERFTGFAKKTFDNLMRKSSLISVVNERERNKFFRELKQRVESAMHF
ncbi:MAG: hypothetical protein ABI723_21300 [Bacteroidia bacterium]